MRSCATLIIGLQLLFCSPVVLSAEIQIVTECNDKLTATSDFKFKDVPSPSRTDAATTATFTLLAGRADVNGGDLQTLHDGRVPLDEDNPAENFFFAAGTPGGRLLIDLGAITAIRKINTYSWHPSTRGPQVYQLYAADGRYDRFDSHPKPEADPGSCGWTRIADVNTRPQQGNEGGQYGVSIASSDGAVGDYRYLLFDISRTETTDPFGNTFFSEIDVDDGAVHQAEMTGAPELRRVTFTIDGGRYQITIDTTESPDLTQWAHEELVDVVREWYPKVITMLPSDG